MIAALANIWVILIWLHFPGNNIDDYCLQALNLQRFPFLPKYSTKIPWRGGAGGVTTGSPITSTSAPRKYRHLDAPEEYARERSGVYDHYLPGNQWLGRIRRNINSRRSDGANGNAAIEKFAIASPLISSQLIEQTLLLENNDAATPLPVLAMLVKNNSTPKSVPVLESLQRKKQQQHIATNVHELRSKILDDGLALQNVKIECPYASANATTADVLQHDVIQLMVSRYHSQSRPGERCCNDTAYLALAIEGGGIRGAVCSGMAAAIAALGLTDSFDTIIGSSAGSVIGAYMVRFVYSNYESYFCINAQPSFLNPHPSSISFAPSKADKCALMFI